ncbi:transposase [Streptomyces sp. NPDC056519]|uniref:transposase n=1 Tax=Streptomyces sp. NPDC056519 TaxID=3345849 RepID=UPI0036CB6537
MTSRRSAALRARLRDVFCRSVRHGVRTGSIKDQRASERSDGGRTHRSEPRGQGQAGFQDARPVGRERTAPPCRSSKRLGRRRWVIERTTSWLTGYRRLNHRYERHPRNYLAFLGLAAAICCYKHLRRLTT